MRSAETEIRTEMVAAGCSRSWIDRIVRCRKVGDYGSVRDEVRLRTGPPAQVHRATPHRDQARDTRMAEIPQFAPGDTVVHTRRPEWGDGVVDEAVKIVHEGKAAQRLTVKFVHHGRVTLNTAVAPLVSKDAAIAMSHMTNSPNSSPFGRPPRSSSTAAAGDKGWIDMFEKKENELHKLPDAINDPFLGLSARLEATLDTYRFSTEARSLIEWAVAQTGLPDPMTKYTRHELEVGFERYARDRDVQLKEIVRQYKHDGRLADLEQLRRKLRLPAAVSALDRARNSL